MELLDIFIIVISCIVSYFIGCVSIARLITKKEKNGDIKTQGSGNPGTMNMLRTHGIFMGLFTLLCDALKGVIPALFALLYFQSYDPFVQYACIFAFGLCAVLGHIFPCFYGFKGGKGIATTFGVFIVVDPITTVILFGILFLTLFVIKIGSVVSLLFITIVAVVQLFKAYMEGSWLAIVLMLLIVVIDYWAHRQNLFRLMENKENPADLQEGLQKDIEKIKNKREKKLENHASKQERIEKRYDKKIAHKSNKVQRKIDKFNVKNTSSKLEEVATVEASEDMSSENNTKK